MANIADKPSVDHVENSAEHEAILSGVVALATLFSHCVEAFGLIHPTHKWDKDEQILLTRLGLQQARLLLWGDVLGISSPPKSVTDRAVPKHPSLAYPDLEEPTFFPARDPRLDDPEMRTQIEDTLSAILDRPKHHTREEMMSIYGLKPPKRTATTYEPALDTTRLEAFRERWELLREVAESYAQINTRRSNSILYTSWTVADCVKFADFIKLTQEKVDYLVELLDVKEAVDRGVRMDIRALGWHVAPDRGRVAQDASKLRLLREICVQDYPEYLRATEQALEQIQREARENAGPAYNPYARITPLPPGAPEPASGSNNGSTASQRPGAQRRRTSGFFGLFKSRGKHPHARNDTGLVPAHDKDPPRSLSDAGAIGSSFDPYANNDEDEAPLGRIRSKSVGAWIDPPTNDPAEHAAMQEKLRSLSVVPEMQRGSEPKVATPHVIRHDQYKGIARVNTKDLHQADY